MNKTVLYLLLTVTCLVPSLPAVAHADTNFTQNETEHSAASSRKAYLKHQKKQMKKAKKQQKQMAKKWKSQHHAGS